MNRFGLLVALCVSIVPALLSQPATVSTVVLPTVSDWRRDIDEVSADIRLIHPDPFTKTGKMVFLRSIDRLKEDVPKLTEEQRVVRLMQVVASVRDGHTQLEADNPRFAYWYPIRILDFPDGYFVTAARVDNADLAGAQVLEIGGRPVGEVMAAVRSVMGADNLLDAQVKLYAVHNSGLMKGLGYADGAGNLTAKFKLRDGKTVDRLLTPSRTSNKHYKIDDATYEWTYMPPMYGPPVGIGREWISAYKGLPAVAFETPDTTRPAFLTDALPLSARPMPGKDAYYIRCNYLSDTDFPIFIHKVMLQVDSLKPRRLIVDLRFNFGGDGSKVRQVIQEFVARASSPPWKELYMLTGRRTFSAAVMLVSAFLNDTEVSVVGEPAGAPLNSFGDADARSLTHTGLVLYVSTRRNQLSSSDDISEYTRVDVPAPFSFSDYVAGKDPAVDPILRGDEMRSIPIILSTDGASAARRAVESRILRFATYSWWRAPSEIDLRTVCQSKIAEKRPEAVDACELNTEVHPDDWHVWYNLAQAQRAAGLLNERIASYRCVLAIDPSNFNGEAIRTLLAAHPEATQLPARCPTADAR